MQLLSQLVDLVINENTKNVTDLQKAKIAEVCASTEAKLIKGGSEELNMLYLFMSISKIMKK